MGKPDTFGLEVQVLTTKDGLQIPYRRYRMAADYGDGDLQALDRGWWLFGPMLGLDAIVLLPMSGTLLTRGSGRADRGRDILLVKCTEGCFNGWWIYPDVDTTERCIHCRGRGTEPAGLLMQDYTIDSMTSE